MNLDAIDRLSRDEAHRILKTIFTRATEPAFGVLPQRELDLLLFEMMRETGVLEKGASLYQLMGDLRITKAKARNLLFDLQIRASREASVLNGMVKDAISHPSGFAAEGKYLVLGIEDPVVQAHLKELARKEGFITDATFDSTLVRITPPALGAVAESLMTEDEKQLYAEAMIDAGFDKPGGVRTVIVGGLTHLLRKAVGEDAADAAADIAEGYIEELGDFIAPKGEKALLRLKDAIGRLLPREAEAAAPVGGPGPRVSEL